MCQLHPACTLAVVSDAASGGQVLMCAETFRAVQHMGEDLGCVDHTGLRYANLQGFTNPLTALIRKL